MIKFFLIRLFIICRSKKVKVSSGVKFIGWRRCELGEFVQISHGCVLSSGGGSRISIGKNTVLHSGVILRCFNSTIRVGSNTSINPYTVIYSAGGVSIGNNVLIATHVVMSAHNHIFQDKNTLIQDQGLSKRGIIIEDDVWVGANASILDGVIIGKGSVIAAGAVVTKDIDPYSVVAGVPAKVISNRL